MCTIGLCWINNKYNNTQNFHWLIHINIDTILFIKVKWSYFILLSLKCEKNMSMFCGNWFNTIMSSNKTPQSSKANETTMSSYKYCFVFIKIPAHKKLEIRCPVKSSCNMWKETGLHRRTHIIMCNVHPMNVFATMVQ